MNILKWFIGPIIALVIAGEEEGDSIEFVSNGFGWIGSGVSHGVVGRNP